MPTTPPRLLRTLHRHDNETGTNDATEWLSRAHAAVARATDLTGLPFRGYHPGSNRSLVALLGDTHVFKVPFAHSEHVTPDTVVAAMVAWGETGIGPESTAVGAGVLSRRLTVTDTPPTPDAIIDLLTADLTFTGGQPHTFARRIDTLYAHARARDTHGDLRDMIADGHAAALDAVAAFGTRTTIAHGDLAAGNILATADGLHLLIDPEPIVGPRELDLARLLESPTVDYTDAQIAAITRAAGLDPDLLAACRRSVHTTMTVYRHTRAQGR